MHRISSRYHVPKGRPSKRKMQALLKAKKRWASGEIELEHQSLHVCENDPDASGNVSSNYENNEVNTYSLNSSELNAATERKLSLLSSHTSAEHVISEQNDPTYVLVDTNVWKNLLSTVKCPECDMNNINIIKTTQLGMASKLELFFCLNLICKKLSSKAQRRGSDYRRKRKRFHNNQYTRKVSDKLDVDCISASAKKLCKESDLDKEVRNSNQSNGYRLINIDILLSELS
ncbi:hypothetical protein TNCT_152761 [Trichonephila clavata]|uniref:Uncharacterized protein n=1 Tax=Trichonephila clavata TaxID=2740835 RepID=A0A8X6GY21_TRICU|nr:hypothetical protein TNCT_152761 [Trichonephila clavata]